MQCRIFLMRGNGDSGALGEGAEGSRGAVTAFFSRGGGCRYTPGVGIWPKPLSKSTRRRSFSFCQASASIPRKS